MRYFYQKGDEVILQDGLDKLQAIVLATQSSPHYPLKRIKIDVSGFIYYCNESDITPNNSAILPDLRPVILAFKASKEELDLASKMNELLLTPKFKIGDDVLICNGYPSQGRIMDIQIQSFKYKGRGEVSEFTFFIKTESDYNGSWYKTRDLFIPKPQKVKK